MDKVSINFENCYGIGKLEYNFDFSSTNNIFLIYASNGTMKTSMAKTLRYFVGEDNQDNEKPCDKIYPQRTSKYELKFDNDIIEPQEQRMLIIDPEITNYDYDGSNKISDFIASKKLKNEYDKIHNELDDRKKEFIKNLKKVSPSTDCESELIKTFDGSDLFNVLDNISDRLEEDCETYGFKYNDIFDKKGNVKKFLEKYQSDLDTYTQTYDSLFSQSEFFNRSDNSFGTYQASEIQKSTKDNSFFDAGHNLELQGNEKIGSTDELKTKIENEVDKIINDLELKKVFDTIDKAISSNAELRDFHRVITKSNFLLIELKNYEEFRKKVWFGYLHKIKAETLSLYNFFRSKKEELEPLLDKARKEQDIWKRLINQFNSRFHVPFKVKLENQDHVILKKDLAKLNFIYSDRDSEPSEQDKRGLFNVLSRGEKTAFYVLQILFDIESKKISEEKTFLIFDDIADFFDYKNKYAIVEYIKDLKESEKFKIIILTHNFDFYRTIASRLNMSRDNDSILMTTKKDTGEIAFRKGQYINDLFRYFIERLTTDNKIFISAIPFLRNIIEYMEGDGATDYKNLTKCLHIKNDEDNITVGKIREIWKQRSQKTWDNSGDSESDIYNLIYDTANKIVSEQNCDEIAIENKIVLSIAIRLKAEKFMIDEIKSPELENFSSNQTQKLFAQYKASASANNDESVKTLDKVVLMTPENIHLNAFMYEPLIDISLWHLIRLYKEVKDL